MSTPPNRNRISAYLAAIQSVVALVALAIYMAQHPFMVPGASEIVAAIALGLALATLGFFSVWLPRGDYVDTTAAIVFAAAVLLRQPAISVGVILLSRCATVALRPRGETMTALAELTSRRVLLVLAWSSIGAGLSPSLIQSNSLETSALRVLLIGAGALAFIVADVAIEQAHSSVTMRVPLLGLLVGVFRLQGWILAAEVSAAVLAVVLYPALQYWGLMITVGLLLIMRQSFALLLEVRASYTATVEVLARSLEAYDPGRRGHAERVASLVGSAGRVIGIQGKTLENMTYAALFHDVGRLGVDDADGAPVADSAHVLAGVGFLSGAVPILHILDSGGDTEGSLDEVDLIAAYLIASFSAFDGDHVPGSPERLLAESIGSRLYAATRRNTDRVISRIEREARQGVLSSTNLAEVVT